MSKGLNKLCSLCSQSCKQAATVLVVACPAFRDPRINAGRYLTPARNRPAGTILTLAEGEEPR